MANVKDTSSDFFVEDAVDVPRPKLEIETDPHRISQRLKQIDFGKNTLGYQRYRECIPLDRRGRDDPRTPDARQACSKRSFDGQVRKWRRLLHEWDPANEGGRGAALGRGEGGGGNSGDRSEGRGGGEGRDGGAGGGGGRPGRDCEPSRSQADRSRSRSRAAGSRRSRSPEPRDGDGAGAWRGAASTGPPPERSSVSMRSPSPALSVDEYLLLSHEDTCEVTGERDDPAGRPDGSASDDRAAAQPRGFFPRLAEGFRKKRRQDDPRGRGGLPPPCPAAGGDRADARADYPGGHAPLPAVLSGHGIVLDLPVVAPPPAPAPGEGAAGSRAARVAPPRLPASASPALSSLDPSALNEASCVDYSMHSDEEPDWTSVSVEGRPTVAVQGTRVGA